MGAAASNVFQVTLECGNGLGLRTANGPTLTVGRVDPGGERSSNKDPATLSEQDCHDSDADPPPLPTTR